MRETDSWQCIHANRKDVGGDTKDGAIPLLDTMSKSRDNLNVM